MAGLPYIWKIIDYLPQRTFVYVGFTDILPMKN